MSIEWENLAMADFLCSFIAQARIKMLKLEYLLAKKLVTPLKEIGFAV